MLAAATREESAPTAATRKESTAAALGAPLEDVVSVASSASASTILDDDEEEEEEEEDEETTLFQGELYWSKVGMGLRRGVMTRLVRRSNNVLLLLQGESTFLNVESLQAATYADHEVTFHLRQGDKQSFGVRKALDGKLWAQAVIAAAGSGSLLLGNVHLKPSGAGACRDPFTDSGIGMGDIVLFRLDAPLARLQRAATGSAWDHTGVVVPSRWGVSFVYDCTVEEEPWALLEATPDGVISTPLSPRLRQYAAEVGGTFCVRQLRRSSDFLRPDPEAVAGNLLHFCRCAVGQPYNYRKVLTATRTPGFAYDAKAEEADSAKGYFCSELCARALSAMGVLDPAKSWHPNCYWPKSFVRSSNEIDRHLNPDYVLSPELDVDLT